MDRFKTYTDEVIDICYAKVKYKRKETIRMFLYCSRGENQFIMFDFFVCNSIGLLFFCCDLIINSVSAPLMTVFNVSFDIGLCWYGMVWYVLLAV